MPRDQRDDFFFAFSSYDEEIEKKLHSRVTPTDVLMDMLLQRLGQRGAKPALLAEVKGLYQNELRDSSVGQGEYLSHPIRVAASWLLFIRDVTYEDMSLALCHNIIEKEGEAALSKYEKLLSEPVMRKIKTLTIDRAREKQEDYLAEYYNGIEKEGPGLLILKALDKLDNTFYWVKLNLDASHAAVVLNHVCPRLQRYSPDLESYLRELIPYVESEKTKEKYRRFTVQT